MAFEWIYRLEGADYVIIAICIHADGQMDLQPKKSLTYEVKG